MLIFIQSLTHSFVRACVRTVLDSVSLSLSNLHRNPHMHIPPNNNAVPTPERTHQAAE